MSILAFTFQTGLTGEDIVSDIVYMPQGSQIVRVLDPDESGVMTFYVRSVTLNFGENWDIYRVAYGDTDAPEIPADAEYQIAVTSSGKVVIFTQAGIGPIRTTSMSWPYGIESVSVNGGFDLVVPAPYPIPS